jgi:hypothetical protein
MNFSYNFEMDKNKQILIAIALPILLAIMVLIFDQYIFPLSVKENYNLSTFGNESGVSFSACDLRKNYYDLGGSTFVSEILRHFALFLFFAALVSPLIVECLQKPIEQTELNLTNKLI